MVMGDEHDHVADDVGADDDDDDDEDGDDGDPGTLSRCSGQSRGNCKAGRGKRWQGEDCIATLPFYPSFRFCHTATC